MSSTNKVRITIAAARPPIVLPAITPGLVWFVDKVAVVVTATVVVSLTGLPEVLAAPGGRESAASFGFDVRKPAVKIPTGQPIAHALGLQQPMKGGSVAAHFDHWLPVGHS